MAAGATYDCIATTTFTSSTATISFTSIPATYTDLVLVGSAKIGSGSYGFNARVNNDTGTTYSETTLYGNGSSASTYRSSNDSSAVIGNTITTDFNVVITHFMNYSNTTTYKTIISRCGQAGNSDGVTVSLWRSTSAINRIDVAAGFGFPNANMTAGTLTLYGIAAA